jgi:4'-phosphopantetheinyl transferase EntD
MSKRNCFGLENIVERRIDRALARWKVVWESTFQALSPQQLHQLGFLTNTLEFWQLAKILLVSDTWQNHQNDVSAAEVDNDDPMTEINKLLQKFEGVSLS